MLGVKKDARRSIFVVKDAWREKGCYSKKVARRRRSLGEEERWVSNDLNDDSRDEGRFAGENITATERE
jgi:hypothetical protein